MTKKERAQQPITHPMFFLNGVLNLIVLLVFLVVSLVFHVVFEAVLFAVSSVSDTFCNVRRLHHVQMHSVSVEGGRYKNIGQH